MALRRLKKSVRITIINNTDQPRFVGIHTAGSNGIWLAPAGDEDGLDRWTGSVDIFRRKSKDTLETIAASGAFTVIYDS